MVRTVHQTYWSCPKASPRAFLSVRPIVTSEAISRHFQDADTLAGGMYSGSAVSYAAALVTQQVIQDEKLVENAKIQGERLWNGLVEIQRNHPIIRDVRGPGCMIGVELQPKAVPGTNKVLCFQCFEKGLLLATPSKQRLFHSEVHSSIVGKRGRDRRGTRYFRANIERI